MLLYSVYIISYLFHRVYEIAIVNFFKTLLILLIEPHSFYYRNLVLLEFALFYIFTSSLFLPKTVFFSHCVFTPTMCRWEDFPITLIVCDLFHRNHNPDRMINVILRGILIYKTPNHHFQIKNNNNKLKKKSQQQISSVRTFCVLRFC